MLHETKTSDWFALIDSLFFSSHVNTADACSLVEVDKPFVPASCCKRTTGGVYVNRITCQYYADGPPGLSGLLLPGVTVGPPNDAIYYKVEKWRIMQLVTGHRQFTGSSPLACLSKKYQININLYVVAVMQNILANDHKDTKTYTRR